MTPATVATVNDAPSAQPRLLLVGSACGGGGAENRFRLMATHMFSGTADIAVLLDRGADGAISDRVTSLGWSGIATYPRAIARLRQIIVDGKYDAALSVGIYPNAILWAATLGLRRRPSLIMTEITRPFTESTRFSTRRAAIVRQPLYSISYREADLVAANSEDGAREIAEHYGVEHAAIVRIPNIVDVDRIEAMAIEPNGFSPRQPSICIVARLDPIKRIDTLLEAAACLSREREWQIDIVGDGPDRVNVEARIKALGLAGRVTMHGWQDNPYPFIKQAIATVLCSEYEGFSNTVLEAMILGSPVITSFCSSDAVNMHERGAALGFPIGDAKALFCHLEAVLTDANLRGRLAEAASDYARPHHVQRAIYEYEALVRMGIEQRACKHALKTKRRASS